MTNNFNKTILERPRIIDVTRKPSKCPVCGERVVDIIYGTGDMTEIEFVMEYRSVNMRRIQLFEITMCQRA